MVSIVLVSHSSELSAAVKALADQQIHGRAQIIAVGGSDNPHQPFGTDPIAISEAIRAAWGDDGVLVLMDLGSAVISGQVALDLLPPEERTHVRLSVGPFVEGAMAAAVQASIGMSLDAVAREAEEAKQAKARRPARRGCRTRCDERAAVCTRRGRPSHPHRQRRRDRRQRGRPSLWPSRTLYPDRSTVSRRSSRHQPDHGRWPRAGQPFQPTAGAWHRKGSLYPHRSYRPGRR